MRRKLGRDRFLALFGPVYEHSPWIAAAVFEATGGELPATHDELQRRFAAVIREAGPERQLALLQAHPDLAVGRAARASLSRDSRAEQSNAGLDACSNAEFDEFGRLNATYRARFGFPFILAVGGRRRHEVLALLRERVDGDAEAEFRQALAEVERIGALRIRARYDDLRA
jgi:OHCU decarboxylase